MYISAENSPRVAMSVQSPAEQGPSILDPSIIAPPRLTICFPPPRLLSSSLLQPSLTHAIQATRLLIKVSRTVSAPRRTTVRVAPPSRQGPATSQSFCLVSAWVLISCILFSLSMLPREARAERLTRLRSCLHSYLPAD